MSKNKAITFTLDQRMKSIFPDNRNGKTYKQHIRQFGKWLVKNGHKRISLEESKQFAKEYMIEKSTVYKDGSMNTLVSALTKLYKNTDGAIVNRETLGYRKHTKAPEKGRAVHEDKHGNIYYGAQPISSKAERVVKFAEVVGIRQNEYKNLKGNDFRIINNRLYVVVEHGKGNKYQWQLIEPQHAKFVLSYFDGNPKSHVFSQEEIKASNKANLHAYRRHHAQEMYKYYASLNKSDRKALKDLVKSQFERGAQKDIDKYGRDKHQIMKKWKKLEPMLDKPYKTRGRNGAVYDRLALLAISCLHLSHWRLDVTVQNYMQ